MSIQIPMKEVTEQIMSWLDNEPFVAFSDFSHAACALRTDWNKVKEMNEQVRSEQMEWTPSTKGWPADEWVIGDDGRGGYYLVSRSGSYEGVNYYDHEEKVFEPFKPSLHAFYEYCLEVDGSRKRVRAQFLESVITYVEEKLEFKPTAKTKFFRGMHVQGPEAQQFMVGFAEDFEIDMSTFDPTRYGLTEESKGTGITGLLGRLTGSTGSGGQQFTVDHLVEVLVQKKWFDPVH